MKIIIQFTFSLLLLLSTSINTRSQTTSVPESFQNLYTELEHKLDDLNAYIDVNWNGEHYPVAFSTELLAASANRGEKILEPQVLEAVKYNLNAFQTLGITAVSFDIKYPVLVPTFPRSDEYLEFYRQVTQEVRNRGMTLLIAMQIVFTDSIFGKLDVDFSRLTMEQYKIDKRLYAETVINELHPDYLTIENEPTTQANNSGLDFSVDNVIGIVNYILDGLDRQTTLVGAGAGTWEDPLYVQRLAQETTIDFLDIHIYPIVLDLVIDRIETIQELAETNKKKLVIGETWLYKQSEAELYDPNIGYLDIFPRDVFDFWIPLDQQFTEMMVKLSHHVKSDFTSLFWMRYFWGYIPYNDTTKTLSAVERYDAVDQIVAANMYAGNLTSTGETYRNLIQETTGFQQRQDLQVATHVMEQNYPNPFNPETTIRFYLPRKEHVSIKVYSLLGREVASLLDTELESGNHNLVFTTGNLPGGTYFYRLDADNYSVTRKMTIIK